MFPYITVFIDENDLPVTVAVTIGRSVFIADYLP